MLGGASTQIVKWPCKYFSITFQTRWVTKNVEMSSLVGFVSRTCSSRHFWGFSKLEQGCPRSWRPEPDPNLIPNVGFPIIASQHFFQKLSSSFGQDVNSHSRKISTNKASYLSATNKDTHNSTITISSFRVQNPN